MNWIEKLQALQGDMSYAQIERAARWPRNSLSVAVNSAADNPKSRPGVWKAIRIARALNVTVEWLFSDDLGMDDIQRPPRVRDRDLYTVVDAQRDVIAHMREEILILRKRLGITSNTQAAGELFDAGSDRARIVDREMKVIEQAEAPAQHGAAQAERRLREAREASKKRSRRSGKENHKAG